MNRELLNDMLNRFALYYGFLGADWKLYIPDEPFRAFLGMEHDGNAVHLPDVFPEVVGLEHEIEMVITGECAEFSVACINRSPHNEIFFDLHFIHRTGGEHPVVVVIRDITKEILYRQSLQQSRNEIVLLQHQLIEKNKDLDLTNRKLLNSRDELRHLNIDLEQKVRERTNQLQESNDLSKRLFHQTVNSLMYALEKRDPYTAGHQQRVSILAVAIARELGVDDKMLEGIMVAGNLHDLGKIYVPSEFLTKPGRLTDEEFSVIRVHPMIGFEILKDIEFPWPVASIVLQHHEKLDGSGYPYGLSDDEIRFEAKILAVADIVEAMATPRPYRMSPGVDKAFDELMHYRGTRYDAQVVDVCMKLFSSKIFSW
jgi:putative nucleotidyltransferase with HDIG domain